MNLLLNFTENNISDFGSFQLVNFSFSFNIHILIIESLILNSHCYRWSPKSFNINFELRVFPKRNLPSTLQATVNSQQFHIEMNNLYPSQTSQTAREHMHFKEGNICSTAITKAVLTVSSLNSQLSQQPVWRETQARTITNQELTGYKSSKNFQNHKLISYLDKLGLD